MSQNGLSEQRTYCYGYNSNPDSSQHDQNAYGICIPYKCSSNHEKVGNLFF